MPEPYHLIEDKASRAIKAAIDTALTGYLTGWTVYEMLREGERVFPFISVGVPAADLDGIRTGNYAAQVEVMVVSEMEDTTLAAHNIIVSRVRDFLIGCMDDVVTLTNAEAITDFTAVSWTPLTVSSAVNDADDAELRESACIGVMECFPS